MIFKGYITKVLIAATIAALAATALLGWLYASSLKNNGALAQQNTQLSQDILDLNTELEGAARRQAQLTAAYANAQAAKNTLERNFQELEQTYGGLLTENKDLRDWSTRDHPGVLTDFLQLDIADQDRVSNGEAPRSLDDTIPDADLSRDDEWGLSTIYSPRSEMGPGL